MNKKVLLGFFVVYLGMNVLNMIIHMGLLSGIYHTEGMMRLMRPESEGMMWIYFVTSLVASYFFVLIFSKGYEGKGLGEGVRYGLYVGLLISTPMAYDSYASYPLPYTLALQWFIYSVIEYVILGILVAMVFGATTKQSVS